MQIKGLHSSFYKLYGYGRKQEVLDAYREKYQHVVTQWEKLRSAGVATKKIQEFLGYSRATYYRAKKILTDLAKGIFPPSKARKRCNKPHWGESEKQRVLEVRRSNPTYGKYKIHIILQRDYGLALSESTVGRILTHLMKKKLITRSSSAIRSRRRRTFKGHAKAWTYKDYRKMAVGERVQVDHMSATKNGVSVKHFQAWDRRSKFIHAQIYGKATSRSAKRFLLELVKQSPFPISSIQVDGGSEFMGEFEVACKELGIELIVLPPASPEKNGGVERGNRVFREEFYDQPSLTDSLGALRLDLKQALAKYNTYRPHGALDGLTPMAYIRHSTIEASNLS
jgi:transposase InsO family protein